MLLLIVPLILNQKAFPLKSLNFENWSFCMLKRIKKTDLKSNYYNYCSVACMWNVIYYFFKSNPQEF